MNKNQIAKTNMFQRMVLFFEKYTAKLTAFAPLWLIIQDFFENMEQIDTVLQQQQTDSKGETKAKAKLLKTMIDSIIPLARKAKVWAKQQKNLNLQELFDVTESDFILATVTTVSLARNILAELNANAAALVAFNITAQQLTDAGASIDSFEKSIAVPSQMINVAKGGTKGLVKLIESISGNLDDTDDLLIAEFNASEPEMVTEYTDNRFIGMSVSRHTMLSVNVFTDAEKTLPLEGATLSMPQRERTAVTDSNGQAMIEKFIGGELSATVSADGFANNTISFIIKRGEHIDKDIIMVAGGGPIKEG